MQYKNIAAICPIFCPNEVGLQVQLKSLRSFFSYIDYYKIDDLTCYFSGYCANDDWWEDIRIIASKYITSSIYSDRCKLIFNTHDKNYGKAYVVNDVFNRLLPKDDIKYILTFDSDIIFDINEPNVIERAYNIAEQIDNFGLLSFNQKEANCQLYNHYTESKTIDGEELCWHPGGAGIAGGCLFISTEAFKAVKGYREWGIYDSDDGWLMLDLAGLKRFLATVKTISIIHPYSPELKDGYNQWKADILHKRRRGVQETYGDKLRDAEEFWK